MARRRAPRILRAGAIATAALGLAGGAAAQPAMVAWKPATRSPQPAAAAPEDATLQALCGAPDAALAEVARRNVARQAAGMDILPSDELVFTLRAAGDPHVWPRAWSVAGGGLAEDDLEKRLRDWTSGWSTLGVRRCGIARGTKGDGSAVVAAIAIDALADLSALPTAARVGQWLKLEGAMLVPATEVKVVLLGPRGAPRSVLASLSQGRVRSTFSVDQPGGWLVQVLATVATGPRTVLEAMVFAGATPPSQFVRASAPGEEAAKGAPDDAEGMLRRMNAARASEGLPALAQDAALDAIARAHSEAMIKARMVGHDVGGGDPAARLSAAGYKAKVAGENVVSSDTPENAHRAIWASPSHRGNLLMRDYAKAGVAVVRGAAGRVWVTQLFAG
jgi:uncharacterized protein YkwD